jgi:alpha-galactosidase
MIWTGSFSVDVEKFSHGRTRIMLGLNPLHLSYPLSKGETFQSPEVVGIFEPSQGLGGMSRSFHSLYRHHLSRSKWTNKDRPVLINNWEATYFDFDADSLYAFAKRAADLGVRLFVMDDGWFGVKKPRTSDHSGLGDWVPNPKRFPKGLDAFVKQVTSLKSKSTSDSPNMKFGIWVEPEMVNPESELYEKHPGWILSCEGYERTEQRNQLVLDLGRTEVQDYIIESLSTILGSAPISYVKWDNNRGIHEIPFPYTPHKYMLGLYRVLHTLTDRFPDVLWEGCASGGGRFDPGLLHYWPQHWTSDDTDAYERLRIQFGTSLVYPPSSMGCHVSACPNEQVGRTTPLSFRAHVAMMGGSFGFELDLAHLNAEERKAIPGIVNLAERINPYVIRGDQYRLLLPEESNFPAVLYLNEKKDKAVVLAFQVRERGPKTPPPNLRLQGLEPDAWYEIREEGKDKGETETEIHSGATLLNVGVKFNWHGDYDSRVLWVTKTKAP